MLPTHVSGNNMIEVSLWISSSLFIANSLSLKIDSHTFLQRIINTIRRCRSHPGRDCRRRWEEMKLNDSKRSTGIRWRGGMDKQPQKAIKSLTFKCSTTSSPSQGENKYQARTESSYEEKKNVICSQWKEINWKFCCWSF